VKFEDSEIPEGINVTQVHPLKELAVLLGGAAIVIVLLVYALGLSAGYLARYIPFETELKLASPFAQDAGQPTEILDYLEKLKERVVDVMDLPEGMTIRLHYSDADTVNAFATLGGNVVLFRGLLEKLPNENALVMLMAHEIAHVKHRDPIVSIGRGLAVSTVLGLVLGQSDLDVLGNTGLYTILHFNREMEADADREALEAVYKIYGHTSGAEDLFHTIQTYREELDEKEGPAFLQTHPLDQKRIDAIDNYSDEHHWAKEGKPAPIPPSFVEALATDR